MLRPLHLVAVVSFTTATAHAQSVASTVEPPASEHTTAKPAPAPTADPSAADLAKAPPPGQESGRLDAVSDGDTTARQIGRDLLWVPKLVMNGALTPVRGSIWAFDRFNLAERYQRVFFNDARTIGLYPTATFESGFGLSGIVLGARFVHRDLFGQREHLAMEAALGMNVAFKQLYALNVRSGNRLGERYHAELDLGYEVRPRDAFYGIGNADQQPPPPATMIDPLVDPTAVQTRFGQHRTRARLTGDARVWRDLHLRPAASFIDRSFGDPASGIPTADVYQTQNLTGWGGYSAIYGELDLRWDSRRAVTRYEPSETYATGTLAGVFGGAFHPLTPDGGDDFFRYGVDLQQFMRLGLGPRVLAARFHGEAVSAGLQDIPFMELPALGGPLYLRGYDVDEFRDRIAAFGTVEYSWDLGAIFATNVFVDAGRVWRNYDALTLADLRVGYGLGLELRYGSGFLTELSLASSIDGGVFVSLSFNPVYDIDERVRRR